MRKILLFMMSMIFLIGVVSGQTASSENINEWVTQSRTANADSFYPADFDLSNMTLLWTHQFLTPSSTVGSVTIKDGVVYVAHDGTVGNKTYVALNQTDGSNIWTSTNLISRQDRQPTIADNNFVYVADDSTPSQILALNKTDGSIIWNFTRGLELAPPLVSNGMVFTNENIGALAQFYSLNATTGEVIWNRTGLSDVSAMSSVANNVLFTVNDGVDVNAVDISDGSIIWTNPTLATFFTQPLVKEGVVYVPDYNGFVSAIHESNGSTIWTSLIGGGCPCGTVAVDSSQVYMGSDNGFFFALDKTTGNHIWNFSMGGTAVFESTPVVTQNGIVFFTTAFRTGSNDTLFALNTTDGSVLFSFITPKSMDFMTPTLVNNVVYFGDFGGTVYAIGNPTPPPLPPPPTPLQFPNQIQGEGELFEILQSSGAGLSIFIQIMGFALPPLILGIMFVGIIVLIGFGISQVINKIRLK